MSPAPTPVPRLALAMLGSLTLVSLGGPFLLVRALGGGGHPGWPPDRPTEWWAFGLVTASAVALLGGCVTAGLWSRRSAPGPGDGRPGPGESRPARRS